MRSRRRRKMRRAQHKRPGKTARRKRQENAIERISDNLQFHLTQLQLVEDSRTKPGLDGARLRVERAKTHLDNALKAIGR
jgi:phage-related minor tail protein